MFAAAETQQESMTRNRHCTVHPWKKWNESANSTRTLLIMMMEEPRDGDANKLSLAHDVFRFSEVFAILIQGPSRVLEQSKTARRVNVTHRDRKCWKVEIWFTSWPSS